ncbi:NAD(P)/FAD-dependent oxidoreductase [Rhodothermus profundi]|uniref:D-amino-acid dehydrogenase n=1 Tax=Rhodothermus profundi TaxID=633813 RepID=A0A1M6UKQ6_9BACT|nr:FAD-dependent oxidoreductase [Rhodothermus profundi]SHK69766.1 D-amino-acid dehydrogenase [Rhodothermus profundi]
MASVVIVGGGAIGLASAFFLHRRGVFSITVLDQGPIGNGCSYGNAGFLSPSHMVPLAAPGVIGKGLRWLLDPESPFYIRPRWDLELFRWLWRFRRSATATHVTRSAPVLQALLERSRDLTAQIQDVTEDFELRQDGLLMPYQSEEGRGECEQLAREAARLGMTHEWVPVDRLNELAGMEVRAIGGLFFPGDAHLRPDRFTAALHRYLERQGVQFLPETEVTGLVRRGRQVTEVQTSNGTLAADQVVVAAGAWSARLVRAVGYRLPLQPAKGYSLTFTPPPELVPRRPLLLTETKVAVTPFREAFRLAGTLELSGLELSIRQRRVQAIYRAAQRYLPALPLPPIEQAEIWAGLRPCTPDGLPVVDRVPGTDNLWLATGHAMLGISLAAVTGELVAALVGEDTPPIDPALLRADRWSS